MQQLSSYRVSDLYIYPVKSLAGIAISEVGLCRTGFVHDRRWMVVDANGRFISQRGHHALCLFVPLLSANGFNIRYQSDELLIPFAIAEGEIIRVAIWDDTVDAIVAPQEINTWFSNRMNMPVRLVYMPDSTRRKIDHRYHIHDNDIVSFADGYPVLAVGEASLALLQSKVTEKLPMDRFRPNMVFAGGHAHDEDRWKRFTINGLEFHGVKPCARCLITTIDQQTGTAGVEPLKTLTSYRNKEHKILFGQNVISPEKGNIKVGDVINVTETIEDYGLRQ